ncbi:zinc finger CCHC domain-containing protein 14 [Aplochiton taeniatus]
MVESPTSFQREGVYCWFSALSSAQRTEFLCGLLDLCVPIELRFLGSCLEDIARKDYHSLRDAEIRANNPTDLSGLTNITDEVVRSKLLVSLALLSSDNHEAARVLYRTLTHIDTVINNYGLPLNDQQTEEQFLLLFTMASNHPAFSFHQKQVLRQELSQIHDILQSQAREVTEEPEVNQDPITLCNLPQQAASVKGLQRNTVTIERIELREITRKTDHTSEYILEAGWTDGVVSSVVRSEQQIFELLTQLSQAFPDEGLEKRLPQSPKLDLSVVLGPLPVLPHPGSWSPQWPALCGVASMQPVMSSIHPRSPPHLPSFPLPQLPPLPPHSSLSVSPPGGGLPAGDPGPPQPQPIGSEQNGILDWLRRLRLHKYYPVFKQLTMEEFLGLTEEDLNRYDLTQGAKKKLKTQLELQNTEQHLPVDAGPHHTFLLPSENSSTCGYSSSPCSPPTPHCREQVFADRTKETQRCIETCLDLLVPGGTERREDTDRSCVLPCAGRPMAQVLPVQHYLSALSCSSYHPHAQPQFQSQAQPQLRPHLQVQHQPKPQLQHSPVSAGSNPTRILALQRKPRPPPLCTEERPKPLVSSLVAGVELGVVRLSLDRSSSVGPPPMVDTSSALTAPSNSLHHVSLPPLQLQQSPGHCAFPASTSSSLTYSFPSSSPSKSSFISGSSTGAVSVATGGSVPMTAVPGNSYCSAMPRSSSPSPSSNTPTPQVSGSASACVCSSCGCRGNCGLYGALPGYSAPGYIQPFSCPSLFTLGQLLHLSPLLASASSAATAPFSYPMVRTYHPSGLSHDPQHTFSFSQPHSLLGNGDPKQTVNLSCYNCGASGHQAEDCKHPDMDSNQQGTFRLKYTPQKDGHDSGELT